MSKRLVFLLFVAAMSLGLSACLKHRIVVGNGASTLGSPDSDEWKLFWIGGLIGQGNTNVGKICEGDDAVVIVQSSCLNILVAGVCEQLLVPQNVQVYCGGKKASLPEQDVEKLLESTDLRERIGEEIEKDNAALRSAQKH